MMNSDLNALHPYPFTKMASLLKDIKPNEQYSPIKLGIGEPKHQPPSFVIQSLQDNLLKVQNYPTTKGMPELSQTIADWLTKRFNLSSIDANTQVLPVMGTREAIFSFVQASVDSSQPLNDKTGTQQDTKSIVVMPNPFYQIYEGACFLAKAQPFYVPCDASTDFKANYQAVPEHIWQQTQLVFVCSPNNPTGSVMAVEDWQFLLEMSDKHDFIIASDECYSELYFDKKPVGLLQVCQQLGRDDYRNCVVFHSLSKRSNLPGLRSGFIAGDAALLTPYLQYRTYQGCAMPLHHQYASIKAWQDEQHVAKNRALYKEKFDLWMHELGAALQLRKPDAGFYFWVKVPEKFNHDDELFVRHLYEKLNIHALAGRYLSREVDGVNPGKGYVRFALVASVAESEEAIERIKSIL